MLNYRRIHDYLLMFLLAASPLLYFPHGAEPFRPLREALFQMVMTLIMVLFVLRGWRWKNEHENKKIVLPKAVHTLISIYGVSVIAVMLSGLVNEPRGLNSFFNYMCGGILFFAFLDSFSRGRVDRWIAVPSVAVFINGAYAFMQFFGFDPLFFPLDGENVYRPYLVAGFMDSPNMLAPLLASFAPYFFCRWLAAESAKNLFLFTAGLVILVAPIAMTKNVAGWLGLLTVISVLLIYFSAHEYRHKAGRFWRLAACWTCVAVLTIGGITTYRLAGKNIKVLKIRSVNERITQNRAAWMMFMESPLLGNGQGFFYRHFVEYRRAVWFVNHPSHIPEREAHEVHNDYVQLLAEGGLLTALPLAAILLWFWGSQFVFFKKSFHQLKHSGLDLAAIGAAGGFWTIAVNALGNFPFHIVPLAVTAIFWAAAAYHAIREISYGESNH
ncbi:MAG: hypothetical protein IEMM0002_0014 [bacterium]|nr:MAG: hypothetical protein IEMM0002_0014 [bacterium]